MYVTRPGSGSLIPGKSLLPAFHYTSAHFEAHRIPKHDSSFAVVWVKSGGVSLLEQGQSKVAHDTFEKAF